VPSLRSRLLVATPILADPNFERTVVLLVEHGPEGALGLVLNRRSDVALDDVLPGWRERAATPPYVFWGGPVAPGALLCLGRRVDAPSPHGPGRVRPLLGDLVAVEVAEDVDAITTDVGELRLFSGYAGWGPDQLESELSEGAWFVLDAEPGDGTSDDPDELWHAVLARQPGQLRWLEHLPADPTVN
jgi:putative transcriptional regulator